jgi:cold shock CspA family protein
LSSAASSSAASSSAALSSAASSSAASSSGGLQLGVVDYYDAVRGVGAVAGGEGPGPYRFHCTAIADGSRKIDAGTHVAFTVAAALGGVLEAVSVTQI